MADRNSNTDRDKNPSKTSTDPDRSQQLDRNTQDPDRARNAQPGRRDADRDSENLDVDSEQISERDSNADRNRGNL